MIHEYENETHEMWDKGLDRMLSEHPNKKPTKSALAVFLGKDPSYLKNDGKIKWHLSIIKRCDVATEEWKKSEKIKNKRKAAQSQSTKIKHNNQIEKLKQELEDLQRQLDESRMKELYLYELLRKVEIENEELKKTKMPDLSANIGYWKNRE